VSSVQAGAHPNVMTSVTLNQALTELGKGFVRNEMSATAKDLNVDLPPGLVGNPTAVPRCTANGVETGTCPTDSAVGVGFATILTEGNPTTYSDLVYNIVPYQGEPAAFMMDPAGIPVRLDASVRSNGDYGIHISVHDITEVELVVSTTVTLWGVPTEYNGEHYVNASTLKEVSGTDVTTSGHRFGVQGGGVLAPFLENPTQCETPLSWGLAADAWLAPGRVDGNGLPELADPNWKTASIATAAPSGCGLLSFEPSLSVLPEKLQADEPAGYTVDLKVPQHESPSGLATPELRDATVALPSGVSVSPGGADGLVGCSDAQIALSTLGPGSCPLASQIGTVTITTPLLASPLTGQVFVGAPNCGPCTAADAQDGRVFRLFLQAQGSGVTIKLAGTISADPITGQLTATFKNNPQLPFSDLQLQVMGGQLAPLANPQSCGEALSTSTLTPWSTSTKAPQAASPFSRFNIDLAGDGNATPCPNLPFNPWFTGDTAAPLAGGFSPFTVSFSRQDREQDLSGITLQTPPGLLGMLSQVPLCGEPQAQEGACPATSQIGHTTVAAGAGSHPLTVPQAGQPQAPVYLTGPYKGAPFGLSIVVPAVAGPFNLGTVKVRAAINVDPRTTQITVTSDPLPQIIDGVPLRLQQVNVTVDRPGFMFNPTNCNPQQLTAQIAAAQGANAQVTSPFDVGGCTGLPFKPAFKAQTQGKASANGNGASLMVNVAQKTGEANIHKVDVQLPKLLPARLKTLQKACTEKTFDANPASCPAASDVGSAKAITPVLNVPLVGPAYLVSHGGAKFPELVVVLQGQGVTIELHGETDIKGQITYSRFETVPDAPITSFQLKLPEGPHSALAAPAGSLCGKTLNMPTTITGQNGAVVKQTTRIKITGCKTKKARKATRRR